MMKMFMNSACNDSGVLENNNGTRIMIVYAASNKKSWG